MKKEIIVLLFALSNMAGMSYSQELVGTKITIKDAWDNVFRSADQGRNYELIGTYQGWNKDAVYIAGYNYSNDPSYYSTKYISFGGLGVERLWVDLLSGNVGIGTTNPSSKLDVNNSIRISPFTNGSSGVGYLNTGAELKLLNGNIYNPENNSGAKILFGGMYNPSGSSPGDAIYNSILWAAGQLKIRNNQQDKIVIGGGDEWGQQNVSINPQGGNVGIGTSAPGEKLEIGGVLRTVNKYSPGATWDNLSLWSDGENSYIQANGDEKGLHIKSNVGGKILLESNVGIGTATPQQTLEVAGSSLFDSDMFTLQNGGIFFSGNGSYSAGIYGRNAGNDLVFNSGGAEKMRINSSGNVGIGSQNPDQKLTVKGKIHAEEVIVDLNVPVADYVFKPTYKLMPLPEVEQFVKTNSHLPEIPSAEEVSQKGMSMGEMQNKLLQKVEELTLYAIQQNKKIETLEKRINELQAK